jgi:hypothetical protein
MADSDPDAAEGIADMGFGRAQAIMPRGAAAQLHLHLGRREIELVVEDGDVGDILLEEVLSRRGRRGRCRS